MVCERAGRLIRKPADAVGMELSQARRARSRRRGAGWVAASASKGAAGRPFGQDPVHSHVLGKEGHRD